MPELKLKMSHFIIIVCHSLPRAITTLRAALYNYVSPLLDTAYRIVCGAAFFAFRLCIFLTVPISTIHKEPDNIFTVDKVAEQKVAQEIECFKEITINVRGPETSGGGPAAIVAPWLGFTI